MITAVVGGQYGSEGKGAVVQGLVEEEGNNVVAVVRVGGPNAGHTVYGPPRSYSATVEMKPGAVIALTDKEFREMPRTGDIPGTEYKMQTIPCGFLNKSCALIIGAGAVIDAENLEAEIIRLDDDGWAVSDRLFIDPNAWVMSPAHAGAEGGIQGFAHQQIGSTGKGVGVTRMARIARRAMGLAVNHIQDLEQYGMLAKDHKFTKQFVRGSTVDMVRGLDVRGEVILEGTQGFGLSLYHGDWPYVTSNCTTAQQLGADVGVHIDKIILVARVNPIRVAGNSGQLQAETSWNQLQLDEERTTVTNKVRRVGRFDPDLVRRALFVNEADELALTFLDHALEADDLADVTAREQMYKMFGGLVGKPISYGTYKLNGIINFEKVGR